MVAWFDYHIRNICPLRLAVNVPQTPPTIHHVLVLQRLPNQMVIIKQFKPGPARGGKGGSRLRIPSRAWQVSDLALSLAFANQAISCRCQSLHKKCQ